MFMVCTFVQAPLQQRKYIQFAPHNIISDIPARPPSVRETPTELPTVLPTQNYHSSIVRHTAVDRPAGPHTQNNCSSTVRDNQNVHLSTVRDNAIHTFSCYVVGNECMEDVNIIENLGLYDMQDSYTTVDNGKRGSTLLQLLGQKNCAWISCSLLGLWKSPHHQTVQPSGMRGDSSKHEICKGE